MMESHRRGALAVLVCGLGHQDEPSDKAGAAGCSKFSSLVQLLQNLVHSAELF